MCQFQDFQPCIATLMTIIGRQCPDLVKRAHEDRNQLKTCLESLGCHGLVNCSSGLIRMTDAVHLELLKHVENLKVVCTQIKELQHDPKTNAPDPSCESHQRQMSMRLSQVFERLKLNETLQCVLEEIFQNQHLGSLLRICRKRVGSDKLLIGLFNAFARAAPEDFALQQMDPVVAQLIISKLRKDLRVANYTIAQLREKSEEDLVIKESSLPVPDYPEATAYYKSTSKDQLSQLVTRFGELFIFASNELRDSLDTIPEMEGEDGIQAIFGHETLIVTYNVVKEYLEDKKIAVLKALGSVNNNAKQSKELTTFEEALDSQLYKEFSTTKAGGQIAEELSQEVFKKLTDYPGVDECITVHQFIQKCLQISFEIQCCPDQKLKLEYDGTEFEPARHSRGAYSGTTNHIVNFIWPALIDTAHNRVLLKAIVLT
uniref:Mitochondria-eating protein n=1 Tax=Caenorhabditis japonica TaxID=281687 RepID=A0A8R1HNN0_CAEJA